MIRAIINEWRPAETAFDLFVAIYALRRCPSLPSAPDSARELRQRLYVERRRRGARAQGGREWGRRRGSFVAETGEGESDETLG